MRLGWASRIACVDRRRHRDDLRVGVGHGPPAVSLAGPVREGRVVALGGAMLTVETDPVAVEERLGSGRLACPGCSAVLARWGHARGRQVRDTNGGLWIVPRRARCTGCRATHVLLPVVLLVRRAETAAVIGAGLTAKAAGAGHRLIAALLGRPRETVRGWLRRFAGRVEPVRAVFTRWCRDEDGATVIDFSSSASSCGISARNT